MFGKTRDFILSRSDYPIEFHKSAMEFANNIISESRGKLFRLRSKTAGLFGVENYTIYSSGVNFNYLICDSLEWATTSAIDEK